MKSPKYEELRIQIYTCWVVLLDLILYGNVSTHSTLQRFPQFDGALKSGQFTKNKIISKRTQQHLSTQLNDETQG